MEGLKRDGSDHRAWEVLARIQSAQDKREEAERSIAQAVNRGLPKASEDKLRHELAELRARRFDQLVRTCLAPKAIGILRAVSVPAARYGFEISYRERKSGEERSTNVRHRYQPEHWGFRRYTSIDARQVEKPVLLAGFLDCKEGQPPILEVHLTGRMFPVQPGNRFDIIQEYAKSFERATCSVEE